MCGSFGGYKQSGLGREWGAFGFEEFLETKSVFGAGGDVKAGEPVSTMPRPQRKMPFSRIVPRPIGRPTASHTLHESVLVPPTPTVSGPTSVRPVR